jgi:hypothetical protein
MSNDSIPANDTTLAVPFGSFTGYMQPTKNDLARPYDSTHGIPKDVQYITISVIIVFFFYVLIRVRKVWNKGVSKKR